MTKKIIAVCTAVVLVTAAVIFYNARQKNDEYTSIDFFALDTFINLKIEKSRQSDKILKKCEDKVHKLEKMLSYTDSESDISRINSHAGDGEWVSVNKETMEVVKTAVRIAQMSDGALDITVAPLIDLWDIKSENPKVPSNENIEKGKTLINYNDVLIDESTDSIRLKNANQAIALGAIAKGYIGDKVTEVLRENGVNSAILNLGGNTIALGGKANGSDWVVGIQNPNNENELLGKLNINNKCVVTSGDYERYFVEDGKRYHHILDPKTGYPADSGYRSVTIIGEKSMIADGLSTACFILGKDKSGDLLNSFGYSAIFCDKDMNISYIGNEELIN